MATYYPTEVGHYSAGAASTAEFDTVSVTLPAMAVGDVILATAFTDTTNGLLGWSRDSTLALQTTELGTGNYNLSKTIAYRVDGTIASGQNLNIESAGGSDNDIILYVSVIRIANYDSSVAWIWGENVSDFSGTTFAWSLAKDAHFAHFCSLELFAKNGSYETPTGYTKQEDTTAGAGSPSSWLSGGFNTKMGSNTGSFAIADYIDPGASFTDANADGYVGHSVRISNASTPALEEVAFRFEDDSVALGPAPTWLAAQDTSIEIDPSGTAQERRVRLRFEVESTGGELTDTYSLYWSKNGGSYSKISSTGDAHYGDSTTITTESPDQYIATSTFTFKDQQEYVDNSATSIAFTFRALEDEVTEMVYIVEMDSGLSDGDYYEFKVEADDSIIYVTNLSTPPRITIASGSLSVLPGVASSTVAAFDPTVTPGAVSVAPSLASTLISSFDPTLVAPPPTQPITAPVAQNLTVAFDPTVAAGAVSVLPDVASSTVTGFAPTVTAGAVSVLPELAARVIVSFDPTVTPGVVTVSPSLASSTVTTFAPTVAGTFIAQDVSPALAASLISTFAPTVIPDQFVTAGLVQSLVTTFAPSVTPGAVTITPPLGSSPITALLPTVIGEQFVAPGLTTSLVTALAPTLAVGAVTVSPGVATSLISAFDPAVTPGTVDVAPALAQNLVSSSDPVISSIVSVSPALVSQPVSSFSPTVTAAFGFTTPVASSLISAFDPTVNRSPTLTWTFPAAASSEHLPITITGTAEDDVAVADVELDIEDLDTGLFWRGVSGWGVSVYGLQTVTVGAPGTPISWSYVFDPPTPYSTLGYRVYPRVYPTVGTKGDETTGISTLDFLALVDDVEPDVASSLVTGFDPIVSSVVTVSPALGLQAISSFDPVVSVGAVTVTPALAQSLISSSDPIVTTLATITPDLASSNISTFAPTVIPDQFVAPDLASTLVTGIAPTVLAGGSLVSPALALQAVVGFSPTVVPGAVAISPTLASSLVVGFSPTVGLDLAVPIAQSLVAGFQPTVTPGAVGITPNIAQSLVSASDPVISAGVSLILPGLAQTLVIASDPTLIPGIVTVSPALALQAISAFPPTVVGAAPGTQEISTELAQSLISSSDPSIGQQIFVTPGLVSSPVTGFTPEISSVSSLDPDVVTSLLTAFVPTLFGEQFIVGIRASQGLQAFAPTVTAAVVTTVPTSTRLGNDDRPLDTRRVTPADSMGFDSTRRRSRR